MKKVFFTLAAVAIFVLPVVVLAQTSSGGNVLPTSSGGNSVPVNPVTSGPAVATLQNPLAVSSFCGLVKALLQGALAIGIPIAVLFIVYAGFKFVLAQGNPGKLEEARRNMLWTVVGIGIFLGAWLLAQVIANTINALQAGSGQTSAISCT